MQQRSSSLQNGVIARYYPGMSRGGSKIGFRSALAHREFRYLLASLATSGIGDWFYNVALLVFVIDRTDSPAWIAATSIGRLAPYVLFGTVGGLIADHYDRRKVMVVADLVRAALMLLLMLAALVSAPVAVAVLLAFLSTTASTAFFPAAAATTPTVVDERSLAPANALISTFDYVAVAVGPALGGLLLVVADAPAVSFAINAGTFLLSGLLLSRLGTRKAPQDEQTAPQPFLRRLSEGWRAIASSSSVTLLVAVIVIACFTYGEESVLYVLVSKELLGTGAEGVGYLFAAVGVGGVLASGLANRASGTHRSGRVLILGSLLAATPLLALPFTRSPAIAYAWVAVEGGSFIFVEVMATTLLQRTVSQEVLGRVFGILDSLSVGGTILGALFAPLVLKAGLRAALLVAGGVLIVSTFAFAPRLLVLDRKSEGRRRELAPTVSLLHNLDIFTGMPRHSLEALAGASTEERLTPGEVLIHEGDKADDFFVIRSGYLEVLSSGEAGASARKIRDLGPGDYAGEIGLVEKIPRTATVRTVSDATVLRITGSDFLEAVGQAPGSSGALFAGIAGRLALTHPSYEPQEGGTPR